MIVGVSGYARAGKDTLANVLVGRHGFERKAFADFLRDALYVLNPYLAPGVDLQSVVDLHGWDYAKTQGPIDQHKEVRRLLQVMGTEVGRKMLGEDVWVNALFNSLEPTGNYVISDVRFPNEYEAIKEVGGFVVRVERPGTQPVNAHPSETALDDHEFDMLFSNDRGLDDLGEAVTAWLSVLR
jgi:hypothetical protein